MYYGEILNSLETNAKGRICVALLALMEEYPCADITVSQVCQKAHVARQTYYRFFSDNESILMYYLNGIIVEYRFIRVLTDNNDLSELSYFFLFFRKYPELLQLLCKNNKMYLLQRAIIPLADSFINNRFYKIEPYHEYAAEFVAATLCSILTVWTRTGTDEGYSSIMLHADSFLDGVQ